MSGVGVTLPAGNIPLHVELFADFTLEEVGAQTAGLHSRDRAFRVETIECCDAWPAISIGILESNERRIGVARHLHEANFTVVVDHDVRERILRGLAAGGIKGGKQDR